MPVVNKRTHKPTDHDLYIGRGSPLGNPYTHLTGKTKAEFVVGSREESISLYGEWLKKKVDEGDESILDALRIITPQTNLVCYCSPLPCHGQIVEAMALKMRKKI